VTGFHRLGCDHGVVLRKAALLLRCNDVELDFEDSLPLTASQAGVFALYLPARDLEFAAF